MKTYIVTRKADGAEVYRYSHTEPVEWTGMEFATHDHTELVVPEAPALPRGPRRLTKLEFVDLLGDAAYIAILEMARQSVAVEAFVKRLDMATPDPDLKSVDLDDPRTIAGVTTLGAALVASGVVPAGWAQEVLNG